MPDALSKRNWRGTSKSGLADVLEDLREGREVHGTSYTGLRMPMGGFGVNVSTSMVTIGNVQDN